MPAGVPGVCRGAARDQQGTAKGTIGNTIGNNGTTAGRNRRSMITRTPPAGMQYWMPTEPGL